MREQSTRSRERSQGAAPNRSSSHRSAQGGGFAVGLIIGLLIGLALALGVALYVTKVPVPFVNKVPQRTAGQDAAEAEKNKNWDPNSPLAGKNPARPAASASGVVTPAVIPPATAVAPPFIAPVTPPVATAPMTSPPASPANRASGPASARDPAAILGDKPVAGADAAAPKPARTAAINPATSSSDPFTYFVQAGAYGRTEDAEQQRAKLAMLGVESRLTEREQAGRTVYRVRVGPFDKKDEADSTKQKLDNAGVEAALVRVQR
ncbi:SPOR domain-containing protein [soil metagenome]